MDTASLNTKQSVPLQDQRCPPSDPPPRTYSYTLSELRPPPSQYLSSQKSLWPSSLEEELMKNSRRYNTNTNKFSNLSHNNTKTSITHSETIPLIDHVNNQYREESSTTKRPVSPTIIAARGAQSSIFQNELLALLNILPARGSSVRHHHRHHHYHYQDGDDHDDHAGGDHDDPIVENTQIAHVGKGTEGVSRYQERDREEETVDTDDDKNSSVMSEESNTSSDGLGTWVKLSSTSTQGQ